MTIILAGEKMDTVVVNNNSKNKFFVFIFMYFMTIVGDALLTYIGTPDLKNEANPLVKIFGMGWGALIGHSMLGFLFYSGFAYYTFIRYKRPVLRCEGYKQYVSMLLYGCLDRKKAKHLEYKNFWAVIGNMFAIGYIIIRVIVIIDWIGVLNISPICHWFAVKFRLILPAYLGMSLVGIVILICCYFYVLYQWYRMNKRQLEYARDK